MLTNRCNLSCIMCPLFGEYGLWKNEEKRELTLNILKPFIDAVAKYNPMILLTGGEPLLCEEWYEIAEYIKYKPLSCNISTNGTKLHHFKNEIVNVIDNLDIAIDGIKDIHNKIRGKDVFDEIIEGIKEIDTLKKKMKKNKPYIKVSFTINNENYEILEEFATYINSLNIPIKWLIFRHINYTSQHLINNHKRLFRQEFNLPTDSFDGYLYNPNKIDIKVLTQQIKRVNNKKFPYIKKVVFEPDIEIDELKNFYNDASYIPKRFTTCYAPFLGVMVTPEANLWLCPDYVIGNLKENDFKNIWNNEKSKILRNYIKKNNLFPICHTCASLYIY